MFIECRHILAVAPVSMTFPHHTEGAPGSLAFGDRGKHISQPAIPHKRFVTAHAFIPEKPALAIANVSSAAWLRRKNEVSSA